MLLRSDDNGLSFYAQIIISHLVSEVSVVFKHDLNIVDLGIFELSLADVFHKSVDHLRFKVILEIVDPFVDAAAFVKKLPGVPRLV